MKGKDIKLTRRRLLGGIATVGAAGAAAGAGTFALFNDEERSEGNLIQAGTLSLESPNNNNFSLDNIKPGWDNTDTPVTVETTYDGDSSVESANLDFTLSLEGENDSSSPTPTDSGELDASETAQKIKVETATLKDQNEEIKDWTTTASETTHNLDDGDVDYIDLDSITGTENGITTISPGDTLTFTLGLSVPTGVGNDLQGEGIEIGVTFYAEQPQPQS